VNILSDWQQQNAIPPLTKQAMNYWEPYFEQWKSELGDKALLDGFNTFPINMYSHDDDLMLRLDEHNCATWKNLVSSHMDKL
jgi:hypothetical protein